MGSWLNSPLGRSWPRVDQSGYRGDDEQVLQAPLFRVHRAWRGRNRYFLQDTFFRLKDAPATFHRPQMRPLHRSAARNGTFIHEHTARRPSAFMVNPACSITPVTTEASELRISLASRVAGPLSTLHTSNTGQLAVTSPKSAAENGGRCLSQ